MLELVYFFLFLFEEAAAIKTIKTTINGAIDIFLSYHKPKKPNKLGFLKLAPQLLSYSNFKGITYNERQVSEGIISKARNQFKPTRSR